jgi:hypothetical protein
MGNLICYVTDQGDPSVGIYGVEYALQCPFTLEDVDNDILEWWRDEVGKLYAETASGRITVVFSHEAKFKIQKDPRESEIRKALMRLVHLHLSEQEGLRSGMPTPAQWFEAVRFAEQALNK